MNQQLRSGIQVILLSSQVGCSPYSKYLQTGASLVTFAASNIYAPNIPNPFYKPAWISAALYLDGLTYITQDATQYPSDYILSRINFAVTQPTASPIESLAILDCAKDSSEGIGSLVRTRDPSMLVTSVNSTIDGRTLRVGIVKYGPFYDNGLGFSVPVMSSMAELAGFTYEITYFESTANEAYYSQMQKALARNEIDASFTPIPMIAAHAENISSSTASITITFTLLRQHPQRSADYLLILRPLAMPVWISSILLAFIFSGLLMLFGHLRPVIIRNLAEGEISSKVDLFRVSSLGVASSFSLTKLQIIPTTLSSRIFALVMWLFSYLLVVLYASAMMTIMLRIRKPINNDVTVDEVLHPSKCDSIIVLKNGIDSDQIAVSLTNSQRTFTTVETIQAAYSALMKSQKTVLVASSIEASYISAMDCKLEKIPYSSMYNSELVFPYFKYWQYGSSFNDYLTTVSVSDVLSNAASVYFETGQCYHPPYKMPNPVILELGDIASIYIFLLIGIVIAFIILGIELLVKHRNNKNDPNNYVILMHGRHYPAEITSIKHNGIQVKVANRPETAFIPNSQLHPNPLKVYNALDLGLSVGNTIEVTYFVRRESVAAPDKKTQTPNAAVERKLPPEAIELQPIPGTERTIGVRSKAKRDNVLHKVKKKSVTKSHKAFGQTKLVQSKLPAHVRFAHLAHEDVADQIRHVLPAQSAKIEISDEVKSGISDDDDEKLEEIQRKNASAGIPKHPRLQKPTQNNVEKRAMMEIRSLTKSESCPSTPLKGTSVSDVLNIDERVELDESAELRRHSEMRLPYHMERLFELFRACETLVSMIHNRSEVCSFDKIKPAVQEVARCDFTEKIVAQFHAVYPSAYTFRYDKQLDRVTKLPLNSYTLVFIPNLRTDGTQMATDSPMKGHLVFTGTRLIQRRHIFYNSLLNRVKDVHRKFLISRFCLSKADLPDDSTLRRWHPAFPLDTAVPEVEPAILPPRPLDGSDAKITSARDAMAAFRARALFREAKVCEEIATASEQNSSQPARSSDENPDSGVSSPIKTSTISALKGVSAALLAKVREREKQMNLTILKQPTASPAEKAAFSALPATITQVWSMLRGGGGRPVLLAQIATRLVQSSGSGLTPEEATSRIEYLLTLMPDWVEKLEWARPHLRFKGTSKNRPLKEVIDEAKAKVADKGLH
ncbi:hypothetical protein Aperf_G00000072622 [Anoplocephala perfoliata]